MPTRSLLLSTAAGLWLLGSSMITTSELAYAADSAKSGLGDPFAGFDLPDDWETRFWAGPNAQALLKLDPKAIQELVPVQAGFRFCRCPNCDAGEEDDALKWSIAAPHRLTCSRCSANVLDSDPKPKEPPPPTPADSTKEPHANNQCGQPPEGEKPEHHPAPKPPEPAPAASPASAPEKNAGTAAEETIEVLPKIIHHYPYLELPELKQRYPGERVYLAAKADYEAREFLSKAALYAAVRYHEQARSQKDPALAELAALIVIRFAQVYPAYATHFDQPNAPKYLQQADLAPPYRRGYKTAKWDWNGSLDVPLNLLIAYALIRDDPAIDKAATFLQVENPKALVERDFFRKTADFTRNQPEELNENALQATRGILAVARLLDDPVLIADALDRLERFSKQGFYFDGFWGQATLRSHQQVMAQLNGWIERLLNGFHPVAPERLVSLGNPEAARARYRDNPILALAGEAGSVVLSDPKPRDVEVVSWPALPALATSRNPKFLGGTGIARLAVADAATGLDVELRGLDTFSADQIQRQALRIAVGGRTVLGDLADAPSSAASASGFDRASVSRNTVVVDGLNQRESLLQARMPAAGGNFVFYAADNDFQVVTLDDPRSYPQSTTLYRQTVIASSGPRNRYAVSVFEINGGLQHDQFFHGPAESSNTGRWRLALRESSGPSTLLPASITKVANTHPDDGRWFVQSQGEFTELTEARADRPTTATLITHPASQTGIRLHLLNTGMTRLINGQTPGAGTSTSGKPARASLVVRRRSPDGSNLHAAFVTVFEPIQAGLPKLQRVGRVDSSGSAVVIYLETADGPEEIVVNADPGKTAKVELADGRKLSTDGIALRVRGSELVLAGGTFAETSGIRVEQKSLRGDVQYAVPKRTEGASGWFEASKPVADPNLDHLAGRTLLITHGDGTTHGWTLHHVENTKNGARLHVREELGFQIDSKTKAAHYEQFPRTTHPGPHTYRIATIAR